MTHARAAALLPSELTCLPGGLLLSACLPACWVQADPEGAEVVVVGDLHGQYQDLLAM